MRTLCSITFLGFLAMAFGDAAGEIKTDYGVYPEPALPVLPEAGGKIVDPTFGTTILRVTDEGDGTDCIIQYSFYPSFNMDNSHLLVLCKNGSGSYLYYIYDFDPQALTVTNKQLLFPGRPAPGAYMMQELQWDQSNPDLLWGYSCSNCCYTYDVSRGLYTLIKDFSSEIPSGTRLGVMNVSEERTRFSWHVNGTSGVPAFYLVWDRESDNVILKATAEKTYHGCHLDKTGRYLLVHNTNSPPSVPTWTIWTVDTGARVDLFPDAPSDYLWGHYDTGRGFVIGVDGGNVWDEKRSLNQPMGFQMLLQKQDHTQCSHYSMLADNEEWCLESLYAMNTNSSGGVFRNEILQFATDGSGRVRRLCHHRSIHNDYYDQPHANISGDGRFVTFSSNWGNANGRRDVFVLQIPAAEAATATNGTPKWWLAKYGWTNNLDSVESDDPDHDGMSTWKEFIAGTDPTDGASVLTMTDVECHGASNQLAWTSSTRWTWNPFGIERCTNLVSGVWTLVDSNVIRTPPVNTWTDPNPPQGVPCFYRVVATNSP